jgi:hypothetical protein
MMRCAPVFAAALIVSAPVAASGQSTVEGHASFGLVNLLGPAFAAGADLVRPSGVTTGVVGVFSAGAGDLSALSGVMVRVGQQRGPRTRAFVAGELGVMSAGGCCGPFVVGGVNVGATFWRSRSVGVRVEGRALGNAGGFIVIAQTGLTFR